MLINKWLAKSSGVGAYSEVINEVSNAWQWSTYSGLMEDTLVEIYKNESWKFYK